MKHKDIVMYSLAFLLAFGIFLFYVWWQNQNSNTLPDVYGVM